MKGGYRLIPSIVGGTDQAISWKKRGTNQSQFCRNTSWYVFAAALEQAIQLNLTMEIQNEAVAAAPADNEGTERMFLPLTVKIDHCMKAEGLVRAEKNISLKGFCREHGIQPSQLRRWEKKLVFMKQALDITKRKASKKSNTAPQHLCISQDRP